MRPECPPPFIFSKKDCACLRDSKPCKPGKQKNKNNRCVLIQTRKVVKKRCPNKTRRNKEGVCEPHTPLLKLANNDPCPNKTRRNKEGVCEPRSGSQKKDDSVLSVIVKSKSTAIEKSFSERIKELFGSSSQLSNKSSRVIVSPSLQTILNEPVVAVVEHSFSPSINKLIVSMNDKPRLDIFKCAGAKNVEFKQKLVNMNVNDQMMFGQSLPEISIGLTTKGATLCSPIHHRKAQEVLLNNLKNTKVDENQIIAPVQISSNCWFNTMFVIFFFSDKGRKFFRFFRQLMITGKHSDGKNIPKDFARGLMIWNLCIEASYGNKDMALAMNTNHVIRLLFNAIPRTKRKKTNFVDVGARSNPWKFYNSIMGYIGNNELKSRLIEVGMYRGLINKTLYISSPPELLVVEIYDDDDSNFEFKVNKLEVQSATGYAHTYTLDSAIVRDTKKKHFCSLFTCNGNQMGFDGACHSRMSPFEWKDFLVGENKKKLWGFEGSNFHPSQIPIKWSFSQGYHLLFYYKTKVDKL